MDYRTNNLQDKFNSASAILGVPPHEIVSVKMRDMVNSHSEYEGFFHELEHRYSLRATPAVGQFQGRAVSFSDGQSTVILVEHETGLEILNIVGSVASLIGLVPLVIQAWRAFRSHGHHPVDHGPCDIEIRRIDAFGSLVEERVHSHGDHDHRLGESGTFPFVALLENELRRIQKQVTELTIRVQLLEGSMKSGKKTSTGKRSTRKNIM